MTTPAPQLYLVPCTCGEVLRVRSRQAGEELTCQCGARVSVPTIRGLKQLKTVDDDEAVPTITPSRWQGPLFSIGVITFLIGCGVLIVTLFVPPPELNIDVHQVAMTEEEIARRNTPVAELTAPELYEEFLTLRDKEHQVYAAQAQQKVDAAAERQQRRQFIGGVIAGVGALLTIASLALPAKK